MERITKKTRVLPEIQELVHLHLPDVLAQIVHEYAVPETAVCFRAKLWVDNDMDLNLDLVSTPHQLHVQCGQTKQECILDFSDGSNSVIMQESKSLIWNTPNWSYLSQSLPEGVQLVEDSVPRLLFQHRHRCDSRIIEYLIRVACDWDPDSETGLVLCETPWDFWWFRVSLDPQFIPSWTVVPWYSLTKWPWEFTRARNVSAKYHKILLAGKEGYAKTEFQILPLWNEFATEGRATLQYYPPITPMERPRRHSEV